MKKGLTPFFIISIFFILIHPISAHEGLQTDAEGEYHILVVAYQWDYDIYDLEALDKSVEDVLSDTERQLYRLEDNEILVDKGKSANITATSRDVQHGIQIEELNFTIVLNRPQELEEFGHPVSQMLQFPDEDITLQSNAHIFAGLGTPDMIITFIVGEGTTSDPGLAGFQTFWFLGGLLLLPVILRGYRKLHHQ